MSFNRLGIVFQSGMRSKRIFVCVLGLRDGFGKEEDFLLDSEEEGGRFLRRKTEMRTMIKAAIFDIGNVLLKFNYMIAAERLKLVNGLAEIPDSEPIVKAKAELETGRISRREFLDRAMDAFEHEGDDASFMAIWQDIFDPNLPMVEFARQLKAQMPVYLLSNISCIHKDYIFEKYEFFSMFEDGAYSYKLQSLKPDAVIYEKALLQFGLHPEEVVLFDDLAENVAAARSLGWTAIQYDFRNHGDFLRQVKESGMFSFL